MHVLREELTATGSSGGSEDHTVPSAELVAGRELGCVQNDLGRGVHGWKRVLPGKHGCAGLSAGPARLAGKHCVKLAQNLRGHTNARGWQKREYADCIGLAPRSVHALRVSKDVGVEREHLTQVVIEVVPAPKPGIVRGLCTQAREQSIAGGFPCRFFT